jgi:protein phosphatase 4 regulatory subunit 3
MTRYEPEIRRLAETPLGGPRFQSFIRRWEMNNEPLPPAEEKSDKYTLLLCPYQFSDPLRRRTDARIWPGQGPRIETEEEDYFNADDDEDDEFVPAISSQWARGQAPASPMRTLKRKRRSATMSNIMKVLRPPNLMQMRKSSLDILVDYNEEGDDLSDSGVVEDDPLSSLRSLLPSALSKNPSKTSLPSSLSIPASPRSTHRPPTPPVRPLTNDDDEDNLLESLVRSKPHRSSSAGMSSKLTMGPIRLSEKRRREDEDDDGLLERLSRAKRSDFGFEKDGSMTGGRTGSTKMGDDPPKKIKLKFGNTSLGMASSPSTPAPSEPGAKDGDTG